MRDNIKVLLVSKEFDAKDVDGIGRASYEIYTHMGRIRSVGKLALKDFTGKYNNPLAQGLSKVFGEGRALKEVGRVRPDIIHSMAPDHATMFKAHARLKVLKWNDMLVYDRLRHSSGLHWLKYRFKIALWEEAHRSADVFLDVSTQTQKEREAYFGSEKPSYVVADGLDDIFLKSKVWTGARRDFVYVGSVEYRNKNIEGLLEFMSLFQKAGHEDAALHIFTSTHNAEELVSGSNAGGAANVVVHKSAPDSVMMGYLSKAVALAHMSTSEGFGIPILESMASGTPVLTLKSAHIPEEVTRYAYKGSLEDLVGIAERLMERQRPLEAKKVGYARSFNWDNKVRDINRIYEKEL
jgi:glycosyltransferase involved in cell wall biosynthesis